MRAEFVRAILLGFILALMLPHRAAAQQQVPLQQSPDVQRFGLSGAVGILWPAEDVVGNVYGTMMPIAVQGDVRVARRLAVFAGFKAMRHHGQSVVLGTPVADEQYATSLSVSSLRVGAIITVPIASRLAIAGGGGLAVNWFEETWPEANATASGHPAGLVLQGEMRYALHQHWMLLGRLEYAPISTQTVGAVPNTNVNLGGFDFSAGMRVGF